MFTPEQVATATGAPLQNVKRTWPACLAALSWQGINDRATRIALAATIIVETGITVNGENQTFLPVAELGGPQASYAPWYGRGLIQCTWESNYAQYGPRLSPRDLLAQPDLLITDITASAQMAALYFKARGISAAANAGNWQQVRIDVNGGLNGWEIFIAAVNQLSAVTEAPDAPPVTTVATPSPLYQFPNLRGPEAIGPNGHPVSRLPVGQVLTFCPDPHDQAHRTAVNNAAHVQLHGSPVHGWVDRRNLHTEG